MSKQTLNVGADPGNQGDGDALRSAAQKIQANFDEIYAELGDGTDLSNGNTAGHVLVADGTKFVNVAMSGDTTIASNGAVTIANDAINSAKVADDAINSEHYVDGSIDTAHIADDQITHDKLEGRFTSKQNISTQSGTISIDWGSHSVFKFDNALNGTTTLDYTGYKVGQTIEICGLTGSQTINLTDQGSGTSYHYKIGGDYDGSTTNLLQVTCLDDSSSQPLFAYAVNTYANDTQP